MPPVVTRTPMKLSSTMVEREGYLDAVYGTETPSPVRKLHAEADPDALAKQLSAAHPSLLGPHVVSHQQVSCLQARRRGEAGPTRCVARRWCA